MASQPHSHVKNIELLFNGGTKLFLSLAEELSAPESFENYIQQHQPEIFGSKSIKLTKKQMDLAIGRKVDKMDITLLNKLILLFFEKKLNNEVSKSIRSIKALRDEFAHSYLLEIWKLDRSYVEQKWEEIKKELLSLSNIMGADVTNEIQDFIRVTRNSAPDFEAIKEMVQEWYQSDPNQKRSLEYVGRLYDEIKVEWIQRMMEELVMLPPSIPMNTDQVLKEWFQLGYGKLFHYKLPSYLSLEGDSLDIKVDCLKHSNVVVVEGEESTGKTYEAFAVARQLIKDGSIKLSKCAQLQNPSDVRGVCPTDVDLLLIDGIGNNPNMMQPWAKSLQYLEKVIENHDVKVIITTRTPINLEFTTIRGRFKLASKVFKMWNPLEPWPHALC